MTKTSEKPAALKRLLGFKQQNCDLLLSVDEVREIREYLEPPPPPPPPKVRAFQGGEVLEMCGKKISYPSKAEHQEYCLVRSVDRNRAYIDHDGDAQWSLTMEVLAQGWFFYPEMTPCGIIVPTEDKACAGCNGRGAIDVNLGGGIHMDTTCPQCLGDGHATNTLGSARPPRRMVTVNMNGVMFGKLWVSYDKMLGYRKPEFEVGFDATAHRKRFYNQDPNGMALMEWANLPK